MYTRRDAIKLGFAASLMLGMPGFAGKAFAQAMDALAFWRSTQCDLLCFRRESAPG